MKVKKTFVFVRLKKSKHLLILTWHHLFPVFSYDTSLYTDFNSKLGIETNEQFVTGLLNLLWVTWHIFKLARSLFFITQNSPCTATVAGLSGQSSAVVLTSRVSHVPLLWRCLLIWTTVHVHLTMATWRHVPSHISARVTLCLAHVLGNTFRN